MIKTPEELGDRLCSYCPTEPCSFNGDTCEGCYCGEAYENYLEENGLNCKVAEVASKVKVTIERG